MVSIRKGGRNAWHFDHLPPPEVSPIACNFTWNGHKTNIFDIFETVDHPPPAKDVYLLERNEAIFAADKDIPFNFQNGAWKARTVWLNETEFNTPRPSCDLDHSCYSSDDLSEEPRTKKNSRRTKKNSR